MPRFPSREWCEELLARFNADPEAPFAAEGWEGALGAVCEAEPGLLSAPFVAYAAPVAGRLADLQTSTDPSLLERLRPAYVARASYSSWKGLLSGQLDPVQAVLFGKLKVRGDLQPIVERLRYKGLAGRVISQLRTEYPDDQE